ncbi:hypothetical protein C8Q80DRAFT_685387 [Daedaleopsis nitida]|nr:hypothetical protein C8Q80DRAFT_685387 [Daedaleopsis nitida]
MTAEPGLLRYAQCVPLEFGHRRIPPEVTDRIIGYVGLDPATKTRRKTLLACALVCSSWLPASRHCLFHRVDFDNTQFLRRFLAMVLRSPAARPRLSYISEITLSDSMQEDPAYLHHLAGHLPNLETLSLLEIDWSDPSPHPSTFTTIAGFPALHILNLSYCKFPSFNAFCRMLSAASRLSRLDLRDVRWPQPQQRNSLYKAAPARRPAIVHLMLSLDSDMKKDLFQWLCATSTTRSIRRIGLRRCAIGRGRTDSDNRFLRISAPSIEVLHCMATDIEVLPACISNMTNLQELVLDCDEKNMGRPSLWSFWRNLALSLQQYTGRHLKKVLLDDISSTLLHHPPGPFGEETDLDEDINLDVPPGGVSSQSPHKLHQDLKFLEPVLAQENMSQTVFVFRLDGWPFYSQSEAQNMHVALRHKLPELQGRCIVNLSQD